MCIETGYYYHAASARCVACESTGGAALVIPFVAAFFIATSAGLLYIAYRRRHVWLGQKRPWLNAQVERALAVGPRLGLIPKLKLALSFYQVFLVMDELFSLIFPPEFFEWIHAFDWLDFVDWLFFAHVPAECLGSFRARLLLKALGPLVVLGLFVSGGAIIGISARSSVSHAATRLPAAPAVSDGVMYTLPIVLVGLFALVPSVCARIFSTFSCEAFVIDDETSEEVWYLFADSSIECYSHEHAELTMVAGWLILLWPIGVPSLFAALLFASHRSDHAWPALSRAVSFLHHEYKDNFHYWEVRHGGESREICEWRTPPPPSHARAMVTRGGSIHTRGSSLAMAAA